MISMGKKEENQSHVGAQGRHTATAKHGDPLATAISTILVTQNSSAVPYTEQVMLSEWGKVRVMSALGGFWGERQD